MCNRDPPPLRTPGVIPEAQPWWWCWCGGEMVMPQSLLHGAGPHGVSSSCLHCDKSADGVVLLAPPTPLTLHLASMQSPAPCTLALGKCLSVWSDMWSQLALSLPPHFREDHLLLLQTESCCPHREPPRVADAGSLCLFPQHSREMATFSSCRPHAWPSHCAQGWWTQAGSVLSHNPLGREPLFPTVDSASDLPQHPGLAPLLPRCESREPAPVGRKPHN